MKMHRTTLPLLFLLLLASFQLQAQIDRSQKPKPGPAPKAAFPDFTETTLKNGLKVLTVTNSSQPFVNFRLMIKSGAEYDSKSGIADMTASLLSKGTKNRTALQFAKESDFNAITFGAGASDDLMSVSASGMKKHVEKVLDLMTDALMNPTFPPDELEKLRKQTLSGLKTEKKDPDAIGSRLEITIAFNDHPYSHFATEESINGITVADVTNFHRTYFMPNNATLAVVGDVTAQEIIPIIEKYFGSWKKGVAPRANFPKPRPVTGQAVHMVDLGATQTQTTLSIVGNGVQRSNPDYIPLNIANSILGGGFSGRLFQNLRETHAYTYGAYSGFDARKDHGTWSASASVRREATDSAVIEIMKEMDRMKNEKISDTELDMHKQYASGTFLLSLENANTTASMLQNIDLYGLPKDYYKNYVTNVMKVNSDQLQQLSAKYFDTKNVAITAVGDAAVIKPGLEKIAPVKMYDTEMKPVSDMPEKPVDIDGPTLLSKHIAAIGGETAWKKINDRTMEADLVISAGPQEFQGSVIEVKKRPGMNYQLVDFQMGKQEVWNDGKTMIESNGAQTRTLAGEELERKLENEIFDDVIRWKELGYKPVVKSRKTVEGKDIYVLELQKKHSTSTLMIDANTYLVFSQTQVEEQDGQKQSFEIRYDNYKPVDGILLPFKMVTNVGRATIETDVTAYKHNTNPPDNTFKKN